MRKFYVSVRPIKLRETRMEGDQQVTGYILMSPKEHLKDSFTGIDMSFSMVCSNRSKDGRYVYEIRIGENSSYTNEQLDAYQEVIVEGLSMWGCHLKTPQSAAATATEISGIPFEVSGDGIRVVPQE